MTVFGEVKWIQFQKSVGYYLFFVSSGLACLFLSAILSCMDIAHYVSIRIHLSFFFFFLSLGPTCITMSIFFCTSFITSTATGTVYQHRLELFILGTERVR